MPVINTLCMWLAAIVLATYPASKVYPNDEAKQQQHIIHVNEVVRDIYEVVYDPNHKSWFGGKWGRAQEAALTTIIASEESGGFNPDVESGKVRGDHGGSWCLMAMYIGKGKTIEGWTGPELIADRKKCIKAGVNALQRSMNSCRKYGMLSGLSVYDTGRCIKNESISVHRVSRAMWLVNKNVPTDEEVLKAGLLVQESRRLSDKQ
jgi:hypothetical protein